MIRRNLVILFVLIFTSLFIVSCGEINELELSKNNSTGTGDIGTGDIGTGDTGTGDTGTGDTGTGDTGTGDTGTGDTGTGDTGTGDTSDNDGTDTGTENPDENIPDTDNPVTDTEKPVPSNPNVKVVSLYANNGTEEAVYIEMDIHNTVFFDYNKFTKFGYVFLGWAYSNTASQPDIMDGGSVYLNEEDIDLYAVWSPVEETVTITFDGNGAKYNFLPKTLSYRKGASIILPDLTASKPGFIPVGYSLSSSTQTPQYTDGDELNMQNSATLYVVWSDGRCLECKNQTKYLQGVTVKEEDWVKKYGFKDLEGIDAYTALWHEGISNWFDIDQGVYSLCWAASVSNVILWWAGQNKKYIDLFDKYNSTKIADYFTYSVANSKKHTSELFNLYARTFPNQGNNPRLGFAWFMYGTDSRIDGAYYKDVFKNKPIIKMYSDIDKLKFNYYITDAIKTNKGISINAITPSPHEITAWGVKYDSEGFIKEIYTTNSYTESASSEDLPAGLDIDSVIYGNNDVALSKPGVTVLNIFTLSLGTEYWEEYFKNRNIPIPNE